MEVKTKDDVNRIDIVDFLKTIGYYPVDQRGNNYWYLSMLPGRFEKTPSFVVNSKKNRWKDFGNGAGTTMISFCMFYYGWGVRESIERFSGPFSFEKNVTLYRPDIVHKPEKKTKVIKTSRITNTYLIKYLIGRKIRLEVALNRCVEARYRFEIEGVKEQSYKTYYALGFQNDAGGWELRSEYFKGSASPKTFTFINNGSKTIVLIEGFFELLTYETFSGKSSGPLPNFLVLNSTSNFTAAIGILGMHVRIISLLNNDEAGDFCTEIGLEEIPGFEDHRAFFKGYNDLNKWATDFGKGIIPSFENGDEKKLKDT